MNNTTRPSTTSAELEKLKLINIMIKSSEATMITLTNLLVIIIYINMKSEHRNKIPNYLIFSQSLADMFVGNVILGGLLWVRVGRLCFYP